MEKNAGPMVLVCRKCGESNRMPCVHCRKCGAKLDFESAEGELREELAKAGRRRGTVLRSVLLLAFVAVLGLSVWPLGLERRTTGAAVDAKRWEMKRALLIDALDRGLPAAQTVTEEELNAWLARVVSNAAAEDRGGMSAQLLDTAVSFGENRARWLVLVRRGPVRFSVVYEAKAEGAELELVGAKLGHLPLPGALGKLYAKTQGRLFRPFGKEARILRNLDSLVIRDGEIEVLTRAREE